MTRTPGAWPLLVGLALAGCISNVGGTLPRGAGTPDGGSLQPPPGPFADAGTGMDAGVVGGIPGPTPLRTFHVSPAGDDLRDGLTEGTAWRTLAKVNAAPLQPGDAVLFQRGGEWHESLTVPASGTADHPLVFAAYGSGAKPKFWGSDTVANAAFVPVAGSPGVFSAPFPGPLNALLADHVFLLPRPSADVPGSYAWSNGTLIVNTGNLDPRSDGRVYTACVRDDVVHSNAKDHLMFADLVTDESARPDAGYGFRIMNSTDVRLERCESYRAGKHHFGVINSTLFAGIGLYAAYALPGQGSGGASAYVSFGDLSTPVRNQTHLWQDCVFEHPEDLASPGARYYAFLTHGAGIQTLKLQGLVSRGANVSVSNGDNLAAQVQVLGGWLDDARLEVDGSGVLVDGLKVTGAHGSVDLVGANLTVQNLLVVGSSLQSEWYQTALASRGMNNTVRFSTIVMGADAATYNTCMALVNANTNFHFYGNICSAPRRVFKQWAGTPDATGLGMASFNLYPQGATFNDDNQSFATWQGHGLESGSLQGDPLFTNAPGGDFSLQAGSPAVNAAALDPALVSSVPLDFAGHPRLQGAHFDMGAFERAP